jgi:uncharacterized membrane protein YcjF (UPF0283 family)
MDSHGIQVFVAGTYIVAIIFILAGLAAIVTEWVMRYRQAQRRNKRLYKHGRLYSTRELD